MFNALALTYVSTILCWKILWKCCHIKNLKIIYILYYTSCRVSVESNHDFIKYITKLVKNAKYFKYFFLNFPHNILFYILGNFWQTINNIFNSTWHLMTLSHVIGVMVGARIQSTTATFDSCIFMIYICMYCQEASIT